MVGADGRRAARVQREERGHRELARQRAVNRAERELGTRDDLAAGALERILTSDFCLRRKVFYEKLMFAIFLNRKCSPVLVL